jgi:glycosyltransferase involved in cell wall biosynthesis
MKILHLISQHPESTGSGFYIRNIIRHAGGAGHQNFLIAGISGDMQPELDCIDTVSCRFVSFDRGTLDFTIPGMSDVMPYPSTVFGSLSSAQLDAYELEFQEVIQAAVLDFSPDIIHSHHLWLASAVARRCFPDIPMVTSCHSTDLRQFVQCEHLRGRVLPHCREIDRVLALGRDQADNIRQIYGIPEDRINIVGGGFDETLFTVGLKDGPSPVQLLYAGKLSFAKGVDVLLRAFQGMDNGDFHLHLAGSGSGEEERHCLELAEKSRGSVTVHGRLSQQELALLMGKCHIFVLPSFYEGLPLVLLEAMACGCRIVATDLTGCRELLAEAAADLVEFVRLPELQQVDRPRPEDEQLIEKRLIEAVRAMQARVATAATPDREAIERVISRFSWEMVFNRINKAYESVIDTAAISS